MASSRAIVLLSGGLDSATALACSRRDGFEVYALTFRYGQRHVIEVESASRLARHFEVVKHLVLDLDLRVFGGSALTGDLEVPKDVASRSSEIPVTYVPARNTIFLSFALAWSEVVGATDLFLGANADDIRGYPDCRPEYLRAFEKMGDLATREGVEGRQRLAIHAPLGSLTKADTVRLASRLGVPFEHTWSCYEPQPGPRICSRCDACRLRADAFAMCGLRDPLGAGGHM